MYSTLPLLVVSLVAQNITKPSADDITNALADAQAAACQIATTGTYSLPVHVAAVFIVLMVSGFGTIGAIYLSSRKRSAFLDKALLLGKLFGIGGTGLADSSDCRNCLDPFIA